MFNLGLLGFFKYTDFLLENFNLFSNLFSLNFDFPLPHILLPLGISFFTFQQIAFIVDCYKKKVSLNNEENIKFIDYALFISFFPQLIAGPIVHHKEMMPQFTFLLQKGKKLIKWNLAAKGLFIFSLGLFKKIFIADSFAIWANAGFNITKEGQSLNIFEAWFSSLSYTFELYFDFSGYCDMAIGLGLMFGIILPFNFNSPYKALNIADFWRRWHITLGRFLKEYLYIPLGGNRLGKLLNLRNLFIVAFLSGIWHGAGWGFVIWGILHGFAMVFHKIWTLIKPENSVFFSSKIWKFFAWFITFNFINIAWIFFRSENLSSAISIIKSMFGITWVELPYKWHRIQTALHTIGGNDKGAGLLVASFIICLCFKNSLEIKFKPNLQFVIFTSVLLTISLFTLISTPYVEFIYFNF